MTNPLPCPFCGRKPNRDENTQLVWCESSGCPMECVSAHIDDWNKRIKPYDKKLLSGLGGY